MAEDVQKLTDNFEKEISLLKNKIKDKDSVISSLKEELKQSQMKVIRLQADIKIQNQTLKEQGDELRNADKSKTNMDRLTDKID